MKLIIIHIGGHKTGSTAIQKFLFQNKVLLKKQGWLFPGYVHAHNTIGVELKNSGAFGPDFDADGCIAQAPFTKKIMDEINKSDEERVIISAEFFEHFPKRGVSNLKCFLDKTIDGERKYKIVYYCRRQDFLLESSYREKIKIEFLEGNGSSSTFREFKALSILRNYSIIIDTWAEIFGKDNMIIQPYEKGQLNNNIFSDFFNKIELELTDEYLPPSEEISNIGLSADLTEFLRLLTNSMQTDQKFRNKLYWTLVRLNIEGEHPKKWEYLSPNERQEILVQCEDTNQKVAREYLGREDGKFFYEPWPDPEEPWESYKGLTVETIVPIFCRMLFTKNEEVNKKIKNIQRTPNPLQKLYTIMKRLKEISFR